MFSDELYHYGTPRHSGRYPWGSGKNPYQGDIFRRRSEELRKQGLTPPQIAQAFGMSTNEWRVKNTVYREQEVRDRNNNIYKLYDKGYSKVAIAEKLGCTEGTVRLALKNRDVIREAKSENTANALADQLKEKPFLDVGKGVAEQLGVPQTQLNAAIERLKMEGYREVTIYIPQVTNDQQKTTTKVLVKDDPSLTDKQMQGYVYEHRSEITSPSGVYFEDYGSLKKEVKPPVNLDSSRIQINYAEDGGTLKDGVIELRKSVQDISLGADKYAQVRIAVDGTHYLKGMAIYKDDMPDGIDVIFNTNKHEGTPMMGEKDNTVLKNLKDSDENPFGAITRQRTYVDSDGNEHQSVINIVNDDTDWDKWSKNLPSQFLSKQSPALAKKQLNIDYENRLKEFNEICELTNPTVKRNLLESFAGDCDSAAINLKAAPLDRQQTHVIIPIVSLKETEIYAPNYNHGEEVIAIRYPHAGVFEIPRLTVNNNNKEAISILGQSKNAVGISPKTAPQLSGADFDGDTVVIIPTLGNKIRTEKAVQQLINFDPKELYTKTPDQPKTGLNTDHFNKQIQMGKISNLITDMTLQGAKSSEDPMNDIVRAVKHSMVIIDAEKHNLDWKQSEIDNGIAQLYKKYHGEEKAGASTLISRAKGDATVNERKEITAVSKMTAEEKERYYRGEKVFRETGDFKNKRHVITDPSVMTEKELEKYNKGKKVYRYDRVYITDPNSMTPEEKQRYREGKEVYRNVKSNSPVQQRITKMEKAFEETGDARSLSSGTLIESVYADYANKVHNLANEARKELRSTGLLKVNKQAKATYAVERASLLDKLKGALRNSPFERQAQAIASTNIAMRKEANPDWDADDIKKQSAIAIEAARTKVGSLSRKKLKIEITPREWEAIQAGAISDNYLSQILRYADSTQVRQYATPRRTTTLSGGQRARARTLIKQGKSQASVARALGVSVNTLKRELGDLTALTEEAED